MKKLYQFLSIAFFPVIEIYIFYRALRGKEDTKRLGERFGKASVKRNEGDLIWLHAVSVGEANSAIALLEELVKKFPTKNFLFTTTTLTSASIIAEKIKKFDGKVVHQFLPIDSYYCVKFFLRYWKPQFIFFVESEIWPNFLFTARELEIPTFLVNARISKKSLKKWKIAKKFGFKIFDYFTKIFTQSAEDKSKLEELTDSEIFFYGNLKSEGKNLEFDAQKLQEIKDQIGNRKFWLAASTHAGEEEVVINIHKKLKADFPDILTIIVPRHPNRADEIKTLFKDLNCAQRSRNEQINNVTDIYLADTLNELGMFYCLSNFAFVGGSILDGIGGHNPFEAIKLSCAIISGEYVFNAKEIYDQLANEDACIIAKSEEELFLAVKKLITDDDFCKSLSDKALQLFNKDENVSDKIIKAVF